ncbi:MAG: hypothetical protein K0M45_08320 [Candidatus Paracaedibacteraceae bacterium]|nr:hypothetical protein [Candidatus Paracaedibacteraceae bacterium]
MIKILYMFLAFCLSGSYTMEAPADKESFPSSSSLAPQLPENNLKIVLQQQQGNTYIVKTNNILIDKEGDNLFSDNSHIMLGTSHPSLIEKCLNNATAKAVSLFCINPSQGQITLNKLEATIRLFFIIDNIDGYTATDRRAWNVITLYGTLLYSLQYVKKWDHDMANTVLGMIRDELNKRASLFTTLNFNSQDQGQDLGILSKKNKNSNPATFYVGIANTIIQFLINAKYINAFPDKPTAKLVKAYLHSRAQKLGKDYREVIPPLPIPNLIPNHSSQPTVKIVNPYMHLTSKNIGMSYIKIFPRLPLYDSQQDSILNHSSLGTEGDSAEGSQATQETVSGNETRTSPKRLREDKEEEETDIEEEDTSEPNGQKERASKRQKKTLPDNLETGCSFDVLEKVLGETEQLFLGTFFQEKINYFKKFFHELASTNCQQAILEYYNRTCEIGMDKFFFFNILKESFAVKEVESKNSDLALNKAYIQYLDAYKQKQILETEQAEMQTFIRDFEKLKERAQKFMLEDLFDKNPAVKLEKIKADLHRVQEEIEALKNKNDFDFSRLRAALNKLAY